jgi:PDDEXK-like uncharacterized protein DUF3799
MIRISKPGIYPDISADDYFADPLPAPSLTQSIAKVLIEASPAHARLLHPRLRPPVTDDDVPEAYSKAKAIGSAAHAIMLGRGKAVAIGAFDDWRTKAAQTFKTVATLAGHIPILEKHHARAVEMVEAARKQLRAADCANAFVDGKSEVMICWNEGPVWFRSLIDWYAHPTELWDYKTSAMSCAPHLIGPMIERAGWHVQAAMHERGLDVHDPQNAGRRAFRFVAQEQHEPYALVVVELTEHWLVMGRKKLAHAATIWSRCIAADEWPSYPSGILCPEFPGWAETKWFDREIEHEERRERAPMLADLSGG